MKKTKALTIMIVLLCGMLFSGIFASLSKNQTEVKVYAETTNTTPPIVDTSSLELWDGTANIAWYVNGSYAGTQQDPYLISNARELAGLSEIVALGDDDSIAYNNDTSSADYGKVGNNFVSNGYKDTTSFYGKYIKLTNHIYLNEWDGSTVDEMELENFSNSNNGGNPINWINTRNSFQGNFDGLNKNILGLVQISGDYRGLFSRISKNAYVKNVTIQSGRIAGGVFYFGGIGGIVDDYSMIMNCINYAVISTNSGESSVGGIAGVVGYSSTIMNCINYGMISSSYNVGGIVGSSTNGKIVKCINYGNVYKGYTTLRGGGGITGRMNGGIIEECYNAAMINGYNNVGGIVGYNIAEDKAATIVGCHNTGDIAGTENVGGIVGYNHATSYSAVNIAELSYSYNVGTVSGTSYVGGIIGYDERGTIRYCYYDTTIANDINAFGFGSSATAFGLSTSQMKSSGVLFGSGFATEFTTATDSDDSIIWKAVDGEYPQLAYLDFVDEPLMDISDYLSASDFSVDSLYEYTGNEIFIDVSQVYSWAYGNYLYENTDYEVNYSNNINVGTATITITGIGNFTGSFDIYFDIVDISLLNINDYLSASDFSVNSQYQYTGNQITPITSHSVYSSAYGDYLYKNSDYEISYTSNVNVGTATITIAGIGNYTGTITITFEIVLPPPTNISLNGNNLTWSAVNGARGYNVKLFNTTTNLFMSISYLTATYYNLSDILNNQKTVENSLTHYWQTAPYGTYDITIQAVDQNNNNYNSNWSTAISCVYSSNGSIENPNAKDISQITISLAYQSQLEEKTDYQAKTYGGNDYVFKYTGKAITPKISITYPSSWGNNAFEQGRDFTISYSNNTNVGKGTITVTGIGNYSGIKTYQFEIVKKLPTELENESEQRKDIIIYIVVNIVFLVIYILLFRGRKKAYIRRIGKIYMVERTDEQKERFVKSIPYAFYISGLKKNLKATNVRYAIGFTAGGFSLLLYLVALAVHAVATAGFVFLAIGALAIIGGELVGLTVGRNLKNRGQQDKREWKHSDCIYCGGSNKIVETQYLKTENNTERVKRYEGVSYSGAGKVVNTERHYNSSSKKWEVIYTVQHTYYYYNVTRKCEDCGEVTTQEEMYTELLPISNNVTNVSIDTMNVEKPDLPPIFCKFCGGKNKGEATKCEHCGGSFDSAADIEQNIEIPIPTITVKAVSAMAKSSNKNNQGNNEIKKSVVDEIREYKKLLDEDIITQEEFTAKKKQLLGL